MVPRLSIPTLDRRVGPQFPGAAGHLRHSPRPLDSRQCSEAPRTTLCGVPPGAWAAVWGEGTPLPQNPEGLPLSSHRPTDVSTLHGGVSGSQCVTSRLPHALAGGQSPGSCTMM